MGSSRSNAPKSGGFSLTELLIVVAVLGIVATIAVPTTAGLDEQRVDEAASEVAQALRYARDISITTGEVYAVALSGVDERVQVLRYDGFLVTSLPVYDVRHPLTKRLWDIDFDEYAPARGVDLESTRTYLRACTIPQNHLRFIAGELVKCEVPTSARIDQVTITLTRGAASATVLLDGLTGRVWRS